MQAAKRARTPALSIWSFKNARVRGGIGRGWLACGRFVGLTLWPLSYLPITFATRAVRVSCPWLINGRVSSAFCASQPNVAATPTATPALDILLIRGSSHWAATLPPEPTATSTGTAPGRRGQSRGVSPRLPPRSRPSDSPARPGKGAPGAAAAQRAWEAAGGGACLSSQTLVMMPVVAVETAGARWLMRPRWTSVTAAATGCRATPMTVAGCRQDLPSPTQRQRRQEEWLAAMTGRRC